MKMKLIGSRAEQQMRDELVRSNVALRNGGYGSLTSILESANVNVADAYIVKWIHEQGEDLYVVLVSFGEVLMVEVPRGNGQVLIDRKELSEYERKCTKVQRLKIAVAKDLLASTSSPPH